jgi:alkaline phosphatase D
VEDLGQFPGRIDIRIDPENIPTSMVDEAMAGQHIWRACAPTIGAPPIMNAAKFTTLSATPRSPASASFPGDRHSFWAGYAAAKLPPNKYEPVGPLNFVGASLISPGAMEGFENGFKKDKTMRPLYVADRPGGGYAGPTTCSKHGVRSALEYAKSFDLAKAPRCLQLAARAEFEFIDAGGHGYATIAVDGQ